MMLAIDGFHDTVLARHGPYPNGKALDLAVDTTSANDQARF